MRTAINELISAARGQAERLRRQSLAIDGDDFGNRMLQAEAKRWQELADAAQEQHAGLIVGLPRDTGE
jgi:outer membrane PBP1 activator LpoA protein